MKKILLSVAIIATSFTTIAQVGIGTTDPKASLDISSNSSGMLIPRMDSATRTGLTVASDQNGMMVYDTTTNTFWFYDADSTPTWSEIKPGGSKWTNDNANSLTKFTNLSDGTTARSGDNQLNITDGGHLTVGNYTDTFAQFGSYQSTRSAAITARTTWDAGGAYSQIESSVSSTFNNPENRISLLMLTHDDKRSLVRSGLTLGSWAEILASDYGTTKTLNGLLINTDQNKPLVFGTNNSERMRINGAGNIITTGNFGVGITPSSKFHVKGNGVIEGESNIAILALRRANAISGAAHLGRQDFTSMNGTVGARILGLGDPSTNATKLSFFTGSEMADNNARMSINEKGDVGIGTVSPGVKLQVNGYIKVGSSDTNGDATPTNGMIRYNSTTNKFQGYAAGAWVDLHL